MKLKIIVFLITCILIQCCISKPKTYSNSVNRTNINDNQYIDTLKKCYLNKLKNYKTTDYYIFSFPENKYFYGIKNDYNNAFVVSKNNNFKFILSFDNGLFKIDTLITHSKVFHNSSFLNIIGKKHLWSNGSIYNIETEKEVENVNYIDVNHFTTNGGYFYEKETRKGSAGITFKKNKPYIGIASNEPINLSEIYYKGLGVDTFLKITEGRGRVIGNHIVIKSSLYYNSIFKNHIYTFDTLGRMKEIKINENGEIVLYLPQKPWYSDRMLLKVTDIKNILNKSYVSKNLIYQISKYGDIILTDSLQFENYNIFRFSAINDTMILVLKKLNISDLSHSEFIEKMHFKVLVITPNTKVERNINAKLFTFPPLKFEYDQNGIYSSFSKYDIHYSFAYGNLTEQEYKLNEKKTEQMYFSTSMISYLPKNAIFPKKNKSISKILFDKRVNLDTNFVLRNGEAFDANNLNIIPCEVKTDFCSQNIYVYLTMCISEFKDKGYKQGKNILNHEYFIRAGEYGFLYDEKKKQIYINSEDITINNIITKNDALKYSLNYLLKNSLYFN